jgi:hypothetical protein
MCLEKLGWSVYISVPLSSRWSQGWMFISHSTYIKPERGTVTNPCFHIQVAPLCLHLCFLWSRPHRMTSPISAKEILRRMSFLVVLYINLHIVRSFIMTFQYIYAYICVYAHICICMYVYIHMYMCMCVCALIIFTSLLLKDVYSNKCLHQNEDPK